jgi:hypothetical protein
LIKVHTVFRNIYNLVEHLQNHSINNSSQPDKGLMFTLGSLPDDKSTPFIKVNVISNNLLINDAIDNLWNNKTTISLYHKT